MMNTRTRLTADIDKNLLIHFKQFTVGKGCTMATAVAEALKIYLENEGNPYTPTTERVDNKRL